MHRTRTAAAAAGHNGTTRAWTSEGSGLSTSSASTRYSLSEDDERPILTYDWRGETHLSTQKKLASMLDSEDMPLRVTKKPIPRFHSVIEVKRHDLYLDQERESYKSLPKYDSSLASITLPSTVLLHRAFSPHAAFDQLYIVSPETSPDASLANSLVAGDGNTNGVGGKISRASTRDVTARTT